ncbi:hypothetical protein Poli38472_004135 [Pythium oligandrum]|uniref:Disease resistance R13L4/SHOC-2-like LRR domain-containing protein n=1 Tax=Pythium oligandrum TaxID=41045 RepID=A0A8K1CN41_PYTOL|nr:hypothetical protein Poli38472_004135 [Pythium oligandrum]|eukprot:TMW66370.1 hypothetical protein Poli38472_004135 [Pythium oligandrum]
MERRNGLSLREAMRRNAQQKRQQEMQGSASGGAGGGAGQGLARAYRQARQTGQLNISTRNLKDFPMEILRLHELVEADEKSWECLALQKADLSYNEIPMLPPQINKLQYLTSLKLRHNQLVEIPEELFELTKLTSLDLSNNRIEGDISERLSDLVNLRELALEGNKITGLPDSLGQLENLESLKVEENLLQFLPENIGQLQRLHTLALHSNQLTELPASFSRLTNITVLDIKKNALVTLGTAIQQLNRLKFLDVRQNRLQEFPIMPSGNPPLDQLMLGYNFLTVINEESILGVKDTLTVLDLRDNKLSALPDRFAHLYRLKTLDLSNNDLSDLPPGLGYLKYLNHIVIDGNPLRSIRRSIISAGTQALKKYLRTRGSPPEGVEALEEEFDEFALRDKQQQEEKQGGFVMDGNAEASSEYEYLFRDAASSGALQMVDMRLQSLPDQVIGTGKYKLAETLIQLNVSKNRIGSLPKAIGELFALQTLIAEECGLTSIDSSITMLNQLQHLRLRKNFLTADAVNAFFEFGEQANCRHSLKELDLRNNYLTEVPSRCQVLFTVDTLLLSYNRIQTLEGFPWASMKRLSVISLSDNQLESLGTVYELPLLTSLSVENNNLRQIPAELGNCENLRALYIVGNPQRSVRLNIVNEGTESILKYLRNRLPSPAIPSPAKPGFGESTVGPRTHRFTSNPEPPSCSFASPNPADYKRARRSSAVSPGAHVDMRQISFPPDNNTVAPPPAPVNRAAINRPEPTVSTPAPAPVAAPPAAAAPAPSGSDEVLKGYDTRIKTLEGELDDFAISQAKRFALKKELAKVRSLRIRHVRAAEQA